MNNNFLLFFLILGLLLVAGCSQQTISLPESSQEQVQYTGEIKEFDVIAKSWEFVPGTIEVNYGDMVKLHIKSIDVSHGIALLDFDIYENLEPGKTVTIEFVADKKGTFSFYCSVFCGSGHGSMKGQLIVK